MLSLPQLADGLYALFLEDLRRPMRIGVLPHEVRPQTVRVDIVVIVRRLGRGDGIEAVVDYNHLRDTVLELATSGHFGLQETLCEAIIEKLMEHRGILGVVVESRKMDVYTDAAAVGCRIARLPAHALAQPGMTEAGAR